MARRQRQMCIRDSVYNTFCTISGQDHKDSTSVDVNVPKNPSFEDSKLPKSVGVVSDKILKNINVESQENIAS